MERQNDCLWQGAVIGGAIGAVVSIPAAMSWRGEGGTSGEIAGLVALSAGIGAGLGVGRRCRFTAPEIRPGGVWLPAHSFSEPHPVAPGRFGKR